MSDLTKPYGGFDRDGRPHYLIEYSLFPADPDDRIEVMVWEEDGILCYGKYYYKGIDDGTIDGNLEISNEEFYRIMEKAGITEWNDCYEPEDIAGNWPKWDVRYESSEGLICEKCGSNAYPKNWDLFIKALETVVGKI